MNARAIIPASSVRRVDRRRYLAVRYCVERIVILLALPILAVPLLLVALAIRLDSAGPVFFRQERAGQGDRTFRIYKFRTMRVAESGSESKQLTQQEDDRITRIGRWLRPTHIDELPQLLNILLGEMSLIGPRPEPMWHVRLCEGQIPSYRSRRVLRPGLTGLAQIELPYIDSVEGASEKLHFDLLYLDRLSPALDARILWRTFGTVGGRRGGR